MAMRATRHQPFFTVNAENGVKRCMSALYARCIFCKFAGDFSRSVRQWKWEGVSERAIVEIDQVEPIVYFRQSHALRVASSLEAALHDVLLHIRCADHPGSREPTMQRCLFVE
eukprot:1799810-Pleurochrysis_carterae.AAC.5